MSTEKVKHLTSTEITTATIAYNSNIRMSYELLSKYIKADGEKILAVKSTCIPLEECLQNEYTKAAQIIRKRERNKSKRGAGKGNLSRTLAGNTLYFNSSVEFVLRSPTDPEKYHNIRISPSKGSIQIQGLKPPIFEVAESQIRFILDHITETMCTDEVYEIFNQRVIIINEKTEVIRGEDTFIRIDELSKILSYYIGDDIEKLAIPSPYSIIYVDNQYEAGSYIRVKFLTPIESNPERKTTVKIFSGRKINILGCPNLEAPQQIYEFLDKIIDMYADRLFLEKRTSMVTIADVFSRIKDLRKPEFAWATLIRT